MTQHHHASDSDTVDSATGDQATRDLATGDLATSEQATGDQATGDQATADQAVGGPVSIDPGELKRLSEAMAQRPMPQLVAGRAVRLVPVAPALGCFHGPDQVRAVAAAAPRPFLFRRIG